MKAIVIGIDGMEPKIVDTLMSQGLLPNLKKLKETGTYSKLKTTNPAESPVAWSSFITGNNPGKNNLFGFLNRDYASYLPKYSPTERISGESILGFIPWRNPKYINNRKGIEFWKILENKKEYSNAVLFCPETFPPGENNSNVIAGMEIPDIKGTTGTFSFYTSDTLNYLPNDNVIYLQGKNKSEYNTYVKGPANWLNDYNDGIKISLRLLKEKDELKIELNDKIIKLKEGEWSDWIRMSFPLNFISSISGIGRFYLKDLNPEVTLYLSPINIDPEDPIFKISQPENFSSDIAKMIGSLYSTIGWECDTWALNDGFLDEKVFLEQALNVFNEKKEILLKTIRSRNYSLIVSVFGELDRIQHMFWRYLDSDHPLYESDALPEIKNAIYNYYILIDEFVGSVLKHIDNSTIFIIVSDHGFTSFRKSINLNRWLLENDFIQVNEKNIINYLQPFFHDVSWYKTHAYSLGIGGIYLNLVGREGAGIVDSSQYDRLRNKIISKLLELKDPESNEKIIKQVYKKEEIYSGEYISSAPDLIVGLYPGYRVSQLSSLGGFEEKIVNKNLRKWSGDHVSIDPSFVPGVFFINRKIDLKTLPEIIDIAPTLLQIFDTDIPKNLDGKNLIN